MVSWSPLQVCELGKGEKAGGGPVFRGRREEEDGWIVDGGGEGEAN